MFQKSSNLFLYPCKVWRRVQGAGSEALRYSDFVERLGNWYTAFDRQPHSTGTGFFYNRMFELTKDSLVFILLGSDLKKIVPDHCLERNQFKLCTNYAEFLLDSNEKYIENTRRWVMALYKDEFIFVRAGSLKAI